jgi:hypothetical protein
MSIVLFFLTLVARHCNLHRLLRTIIHNVHLELLDKLLEILIFADSVLDLLGQSLLQVVDAIAMFVGGLFAVRNHIFELL